MPINSMPINLGILNQTIHLWRKVVGNYFGINMVKVAQLEVEQLSTNPRVSDSIQMYNVRMHKNNYFNNKKYLNILVYHP